jgi:SpoVK/Ycf46/Vps4 family AAA+-type ATPase
LFVQLDGLASDNTDVLVMAATNLPWHLDAALRRRLVAGTGHASSSVA